VVLAGDLRVMKKFRAAGFAGEYHTQDIGTEFEYTFRDLTDIPGPYDAVLCFDVIEHVPLETGLRMIERMAGLLAPGGVMILQTPNARCVRDPMSWDMTHVQLYNLTDLWAFARTMGLAVEGYRVVFQGGPRRPLRGFFRQFAARYVATRLLGADYADNIALIARKPVT
jgi:hypothetical protein